MFSRGQVTSEYLLMSVVAIALVSISLTALFRIKDDGEKNYGLLQFKDSVATIYNAAEDACALGNGNSRRVTIESPLSISTDEASGYVVFVSESRRFGKEERIVKDFTCKLSDGASADGNMIVSNKDGKIEVIKDG